MAKPPGARRRDYWQVIDATALRECIEALKTAAGTLRAAADLAELPLSKLSDYTSGRRREMTDATRYALLRATVRVGGRESERIRSLLSAALAPPPSVREVQVERDRLLRQHVESGGVVDTEVLSRLSREAASMVRGPFPEPHPSLRPRPRRPQHHRVEIGGAFDPSQAPHLAEIIGRRNSERLRRGNLAEIPPETWSRLPLQTPVRATRAEVDALLRGYRGTFGVLVERFEEPVAAGLADYFAGVAADRRFVVFDGATRGRASRAPMREQGTVLWAIRDADDSEHFCVAFLRHP